MFLYVELFSKFYGVGWVGGGGDEIPGTCCLSLLISSWELKNVKILLPP
jgi:hypothetical protein